MLGIVSNDLMTQCTREITGFEIVLSGFFSSIGIWPNHHVTEKQRRKAADVLRFLEAAHLADKPVEEMSSGEARRMLIGRALVHDPKALLTRRAIHQPRSVRPARTSRKHPQTRARRHRASSS